MNCPDKLAPVCSKNVAYRNLTTVKLLMKCNYSVCEDEVFVYYAEFFSDMLPQIRSKSHFYVEKKYVVPFRGRNKFKVGGNIKNIFISYKFAAMLQGIMVF